MAGSSLMDMALDDIIKQKAPTTPRTRGRRTTRGRGRTVGLSRPTGAIRRRGRSNRPSLFKTRESTADKGVWEHDLFDEEDEEEPIAFQTEAYRSLQGTSQNGAKVHIDNLEYTVSEQDLRQIFERVGSVKRATIYYDKSGRSKGSGEVTFVKREDALSAVKKLNAVEVDGKAIKLTIIDSDQPRQRTVAPRRQLSTRGRTRGVRVVARASQRGRRVIRR